MKKYKIVGSSDQAFMNIEMNIVFDDISIGKNCEVFGKVFTITQTGKCIVLANSDWVLTLLEIDNPDNEIKWGHRISDSNDLRINHEVDIFIRDKIIKISKTDRLGESGVTFRALFEFLQKEWRYIGELINSNFPFEYDSELKLFTMREEWNFDSNESSSLVKDGSFSRYNSDGRCI